MEERNDISPEQRLVELLSGYFDQSLGETERQELERRLMTSASARSLYWEMARLHGLAREWGLGRAADAQAHAMNGRRLRRACWVSAAVLVIAAMGLAAWIASRPSIPPVALPPPPTTAESPVDVASVADAETAVWATPGQISGDRRVRTGLLRLQSGSARLLFDNGAEVLLDAPASLSIDSTFSTRLNLGSILVNAPSVAKGFTVHVGTIAVVDQGTRFGVAAHADRPTEVHVFEGRVDLHPAEKALVSLAAGQAVRSNSAGFQSIPANSAGLPDAGRFADARDAEASRLDAWRTTSRQFSAGQGVVIHQRFDDKQIHSAATRNDASTAIHAVLRGGGASPGRWVGKSSLRFADHRDGIAMTVPGTYSAMTIGVWVRVDALPNQFNALLRSDRLSRGSIHWHIDNAGRVRFGYPSGHRDFKSFDTGETTEWEVVASSPVMADRLGLWTFLAITYDAGSATATHWMNGVEIARQSLRRPLPLTIGASMLGNAAESTEADSLHLSGRIDEFFLVDRAMSADEVRGFYDATKPGTR